MLPHVGETDTDTLTENPGRPAEAEEVNQEEEEEEEEEFGYNWSEFTISISKGGSYCTYLEFKNVHFVIFLSLFSLISHLLKVTRCCFKCVVYRIRTCECDLCPVFESVLLEVSHKTELFHGDRQHIYVCCVCIIR